ncbi:MAG: response regulator [Verrucomicrobia bacterium]|nr:response regulator [Verrucomicrobiota bacterium]MBI3868885.1 response regulator [Verrucomicrobiota bacterium]
MEVVARLLPALGKGVVLAIGRDISAQRAAERARAELEARLRQSQKMEAVGTLAGGVAHDFNNILGVILGNVELARQDLDPKHPALDSLDEILKASRRGKSLVRQILAFSRRQPPDKKALQLMPLIEDAVKMLRATLSAGVAIRTRHEDESLTVLADPIQVHQVLLNLCTNAAQAMEHLGEIDVCAERVLLRDGAGMDALQLSAGEYASIRVSDTGPGVLPSHLEHLFEPFFTTKPDGQGTGLGLSVVHGIMQSHKGAVRVIGEPGRGATFQLLFPTTRPSEKPPGTSPAPCGRGAGESILVLDDEPSVLSATRKVLERHGYLVHGFTRPQDALDAMKDSANPVALIITDYRMPGMDGMRFVEEAAQLRPGTPVVLTSGFVSDELRTAASALGVRSILLKPCTGEEICGVVQESVLRSSA